MENLVTQKKKNCIYTKMCVDSVAWKEYFDAHTCMHAHKHTHTHMCTSMYSHTCMCTWRGKVYFDIWTSIYIKYIVDWFSSDHVFIITCRWLLNLFFSSFFPWMKGNVCQETVFLENKSHVPTFLCAPALFLFLRLRMMIGIHRIAECICSIYMLVQMTRSHLLTCLTF